MGRGGGGGGTIDAHSTGTLSMYTVGHKDGIYLFPPQFHGIFLAVGDI